MLPRRLSRELADLDGSTVRIGGHLEEFKALGGVAFAIVRDGAGTSQVTLKRGVTDPKLFELFADLPRESVVEVVGTVQRSAKANRGVELLPQSADCLSRAEVPLPLGVADRIVSDLDTRLDHRVLDLRKPEVRAVFRLRAALLEGLRRSLHGMGFLEIETPKLLKQGAEGGATLFRVDYFETPAFLAQSPQLYKQMAVSAGFERVFEIAPAFRAEPSDTVRHITEFTSLDVEFAFPDGADGIRAVLERMVVDALGHARETLRTSEPTLAERLPQPSTPFPRLSFAEVEKRLGRPGASRDLSTEDEKRLGELLEREHRSPFFFVTDFPTAVKAQTFYAARQREDPSLTGYFDLYGGPLELASGGPREHELPRLLENIRSAGLDPANFGGYLEAFRFGMPPHGGFGFGVDRIVKLAAALPNIRESRLFPRDRYRLEP